ncbi:MAG: hypothetical protein OZ928_17170 [Polyangiaceae bacterium]|nr:hypothetical protein [Polyangiaceae bacterium]
MRRLPRFILIGALASALAGCAEGSDVPYGAATGGVAGQDSGASGGASSAGAAGGGGAGAAGGTANPCAGVTCNTPPANTCLDEDTLQVHGATGTCDDGQCSYSSSTTACPCKNGACTTNPCIGVTCNTPPANRCADGSTLTVYDAPGSCHEGACSYTTHAQYCAYGCDADTCTGDPCAGKSCLAPPANYCSSASELTIYEASGTCQDGNCGYDKHTAFCQYGCANGVCAGDPCAGVSCQSPQASFCVDANSLRVFGAPGSCNQGVCTYPSNDEACAHGCVSGVCRDCATSTDCDAGKRCDGGKCVACDTPATCGPTCGACTGATPACGGAALGCQCTMSPDSCGGQTVFCSAGSCVACGPSACGNGRCDCGETAASCAADCRPACPTPLSLGTFDAGADGWTFDGLWRRESGGYMVAGSGTKYASSYTQNLTSGTSVDLSSCASAMLGYSVRLNDDPNYDRKGSDKSERLYVQCSGDGGGSWTNLTPSPWPKNQSACSSSYCSGSYGNDRSFPSTLQSLALPAACRTSAVKIRFQAKGASAWNLQNPGWYVDSVTVD